MAARHARGGEGAKVSPRIYGSHLFLDERDGGVAFETRICETSCRFELWRER